MGDSTSGGDDPKRRKMSTSPLSKFLDKILQSKPVKPRDTVDELGQTFPLLNRKKQMEEISKNVQFYAKKKEKKTLLPRDDCRIQVIPGCSGIGKSKFLYHLQSALPDSCCYVKISYSDGDNLTEFDIKHPIAGLFWRIVFFGFCRDDNEEPSFGTFLRKMEAEFGIDVIKDVDLDILHKSWSQGLLVLGIDEFNYVKEQLPRLVPVLGGAMIKWIKGFFPILASTAMQPLSEVISRSYSYDIISMNPLNHEDCLEIVRTQDWLGDAALMNRPFRKLLNFTGGFPKLISLLLQQCQLQLGFDRNMRNWNYTKVYSNVCDEISKRFPGPSAENAIHLLLAAFTRKVVERSTVELHKSYNELEAEGLVILEKYNDSNRLFRVRIPILIAQSLIAKSIGPDKDFRNMQADLRRLCPWNEDLPVIDFNDFERVIGKYLTLKFTALLIDNRLSSTEYKVGHLLKGRCDSKTAEWYDETLVLQRRDYIALPTRFPASSVLVEGADASWSTIQSGNICFGGGVADVVFLLGEVLVWCQMKRYLTTDFTDKLIEAKHKKVVDAMRNSAREWRLVFITNCSSPFGDDDDIPYNTIIIGGEDFREFLGPIVADQLGLHIATSKPLDANIATVQEFIFAVWPKEANSRTSNPKSQIAVQKRESGGRFKDWNDFHTRVLCDGTKRCTCARTIQPLLTFS